MLWKPKGLRDDDDLPSAANPDDLPLGQYNRRWAWYLSVGEGFHPEVWVVWSQSLQGALDTLVDEQAEELGSALVDDDELGELLEEAMEDFDEADFGGEAGRMSDAAWEQATADLTIAGDGLYLESSAWGFIGDYELGKEGPFSVDPYILAVYVSLLANESQEDSEDGVDLQELPYNLFERLATWALNEEIEGLSPIALGAYLESHDVDVPFAPHDIYIAAFNEDFEALLVYADAIEERTGMLGWIIQDLQSVPDSA